MLAHLCIVSLLLAVFISQVEGYGNEVGCHIYGDSESVSPQPKLSSLTSPRYCFAHGTEVVTRRLASTAHSGAVNTPAPAIREAKTVRALAMTSLSDCHLHGTAQVCVTNNGDEVQVLGASSSSSSLPTAYSGCHLHGSEQVCRAPDGSEVEIVALTEHSHSHGEHEHGHGDAHDEHHQDDSDHDGLSHGDHDIHGHDGHSHGGHSHDDHDDHDHDGHSHGHGDSHSGHPSGKENCHFHAGIEHCHDDEAGASCERKDRDYKIGLRIGLIFPMLAASALAVYAPLLLKKLLHMDTSNIGFTIIKQFGTGVIIATAFIHLLTHAQLMFGNECLGHLSYESTTTAIAMAGAFISFLVEYIGHRLAAWRRRLANERAGPAGNVEEAAIAADAAKQPLPHNAETGLARLSHHDHVDACVDVGPNDAMSVIVLEAGIIFHSILLGITLVVAGDSGFVPLYIVILFHQMFEGLALGARIAALDNQGHAESESESESEVRSSATWRLVKTWVLPLTFALVTPVGMAIGIGVLNHFNGNSPSTIIALGTLDALSAGVLCWVAFVSMWAADWLYGELREAPLGKTIVAFCSLACGMILMGVLGKWA